MNKIKVSIIIPVYNPGELLRRSLDSAVNQTLNDIEIICIDDGSKDGSADILKEYAEKDSRFVILTQENSGAGQARNNGLQHANGEYIVFLDSDDCLDKEMCELLYWHAENLNVDLVLFDSRWYFEDSRKNFNHFDFFKEDYESFVFDYEFIHNKVFSGFFGVIWTKFYKASFLRKNNLLFPSHKMFNDIEFHIKSVLLADRIAYYPKILYHYNKTGQPSLQTSYLGKREAMVFYDVMVGVRDFIIENGFMDEFRLDFLNFSFRHFYSKIKEMDEEYKEEYFLKIKSFFESILISSDEFNQMSFRNLPIYVHIVNSNSYKEFKMRHECFDMEVLDPKKYPNLIDTSNLLQEENIERMEDIDGEYLAYDNRTDLNIEKHKNDCNNLYIIRLEDRLGRREDALRLEINELN